MCRPLPGRLRRRTGRLGEVDSVNMGVAVLAAFRWWERRRAHQGTDPLVHLSLLGRPGLRSGPTPAGVTGSKR
ncbi:hypothetical protein [Streptomyces peucetius]|nr:hypothetical protein CGZ69_15005 [Streptomyces peucetius subsp. caesius ATCC 27952]